MAQNLKAGHAAAVEEAGVAWIANVDDPWDACLLALDGDGLYAYSSLLLVRALMHEIFMWENRLADDEEHDAGVFIDAGDRPGVGQEVQVPEEKQLLPCHYFDFFFGSSNGGLVAILLGRFRMTIDDATAAFVDIHRAMFSTVRSWLPFMTKYDHRSFERHLTDILRDRGVRTATTTSTPFMLDERSDSVKQIDVTSSRLAHVCCSTNLRSVPRPEAHLLRSYQQVYSDDLPPWIVPYNNSKDTDLNIGQVIRATTALPFYLEPLQVDLGGSRRMLAARTELPFNEALSEWAALFTPSEGSQQDTPVNPAVLLSIGSNNFDLPTSEMVRNWPVIGQVSKRIEVRDVHPNIAGHQQMKAHASGENTWYKRFEVSDGLDGIKLDDTMVEAQHKVARATRRFLERERVLVIDDYASPRHKLRHVAEKLVRMRRARQALGGPRWTTFASENF